MKVTDQACAIVGSKIKFLSVILNFVQMFFGSKILHVFRLSQILLCCSQILEWLLGQFLPMYGLEYSNTTFNQPFVYLYENKTCVLRVCYWILSCLEHSIQTTSTPSTMNIGRRMLSGRQYFLNKRMLYDVPWSYIIRLQDFYNWKDTYGEICIFSPLKYYRYFYFKNVLKDQI